MFWINPCLVLDLHVRIFERRKNILYGVYVYELDNNIVHYSIYYYTIIQYHRIIIYSVRVPTAPGRAGC